MNFDIDFRTKIVSGEDCVKKNASLISAKRAFIVTGKSGAKKSGALDDILAVLGENGAEYEIFDRIGENPLLSVCVEGGKRAAEFGADAVIGIGGGSALDASKAVALYASCRLDDEKDLFDKAKCTGCLPIYAVPTTAGTGSEANPYAVMTLDGGRAKKSISNPLCYPKVSFVDPKYTYSLSGYYTVSTALDAFAHALESYLSPKSTVFSESLALFAAKNIYSVLSENTETFDGGAREKLAYSSCAAGAAISVTGTGFPHPLGYSITLLHGIPHGIACAVFDGDFIELNDKTDEGHKKLDKFFRFIGTDRKTLISLLSRLSETGIKLSPDEIKEHVDLIKGAGNYVNSPYVLSDEEKYGLYKKHFAE